MGKLKLVEIVVLAAAALLAAARSIIKFLAYAGKMGENCAAGAA